MTIVKTSHDLSLLKNPIIIGSSGLTESVEKIKELANNGAGAVVLKSLFEDAGADALEINVSMLPADDNLSGEENEKIYFDIIKKVRKEVNIPISLK